MMIYDDLSDLPLVGAPRKTPTQNPKRGALGAASVWGDGAAVLA